MPGESTEMQIAGSMLEDRRRISGLFFEDGGRIMVGSCGVTLIECYAEAGQMANVAWFAVWCGPHLRQRVNGAMVTNVMYEEGKP